MKAYKVVLKQGDGSFKSCIISRAGITVRYEIGKTSVATIPGTPLMVFANMWNALSFVGNQVWTTHEEYTVLECECVVNEEKWKEVDFLLRANTINEGYDDESIKGALIKHWNNDRYYQLYIGLSEMPLGTLLTESVTPIKLVDQDEIDTFFEQLD